MVSRPLTIHCKGLTVYDLSEYIENTGKWGRRGICLLCFSPCLFFYISAALCGLWCMFNCIDKLQLWSQCIGWDNKPIKRQTHQRKSNGIDLQTGWWTTRATAESWESENQQLTKTQSGKNDPENLSPLDKIVSSIWTTTFMELIFPSTSFEV